MNKGIKSELYVSNEMRSSVIDPYQVRGRHGRDKSAGFGVARSSRHPSLRRGSSKTPNLHVSGRPSRGKTLRMRSIPGHHLCSPELRSAPSQRSSTPLPFLSRFSLTDVNNCDFPDFGITGLDDENLTRGHRGYESLTAVGGTGVVVKVNLGLIGEVSAGEFVDIADDSLHGRVPAVV